MLENDANAAALGEMWLGAGRDVKELILLTLGTGIGGGIVVGGEVLAGAHGMAGEIGHMTVIPDGNPCGCGNCGCLEKHASATAIAGMGRMMHMGTDITAAGVHKLATEGNASAILIFESVGKALGHRSGEHDQSFQLPALSAERRTTSGLGLFCPIDVCRDSKEVFDLQPGRRTHRESSPGRRRWSLWRSVSPASAWNIL